MRFLFVEYNKYHNSIDITCGSNYMLRLSCEQVEGKLVTTPYSQLELNALAHDCELQVWIDAVDNLHML